MAKEPREGLHEVEIHALGSGGEGVGRMDDGRVVFVHRTAPGDRVRLRLVQEKRRWARGELAEVVRAGPDRRVPPCRYYARCGGCTLQHLEPHAQLAARGAQLRDALERIGKLQDLPPVELHPAASEFGYRNRASFTLRRLGIRPIPGSLKPTESRVVAGFHALDAPGRIVDLTPVAGHGTLESHTPAACLLLAPALDRLWAELRRHWGPNAHRLPSGSELRLTLRILTDETGILLVEGGGAGGDAEALLAAIPSLRSVWSRSGGRAPVCLAGDAAADLLEPWFGEEIPVRPGAFLQVNPEGAQRLHALALDELAVEAGDRVVDAYAGFGVYGRAAARAGASATGIELDPQAVAMGEARPVPGFTLLQGTVESRIAEVLPADKVLLNPPRTGAEAAVMEALAGTPPQRIVYVSCDAATLARDLRLLGPGFRIVRLQALDLFPQTSHVETVATLLRQPSHP